MNIIKTVFGWVISMHFTYFLLYLIKPMSNIYSPMYTQAPLDSQCIKNTLNIFNYVHTRHHWIHNVLTYIKYIRNNVRLPNP